MNCPKYRRTILKIGLNNMHEKFNAKSKNSLKQTSVNIFA